MHSQGIDLSDERALGSLELPESLHSLILSRIDTLVESSARTLKVASVVGRVFRARCSAASTRSSGRIDEVRTDLDSLGRGRPRESRTTSRTSRTSSSTP